MSIILIFIKVSERMKTWRQTRDRHNLLQAVAQGQELVLNCAEYPKAMSCVGGLIQRLTSCPGEAAVSG
jgi:hypothetical protein